MARQADNLFLVERLGYEAGLLVSKPEICKQIPIQIYIVSNFIDTFY